MRAPLAPARRATGLPKIEWRIIQSDITSFVIPFIIFSDSRQVVSFQYSFYEGAVLDKLEVFITL